MQFARPLMVLIAAAGLPAAAQEADSLRLGSVYRILALESPRLTAARSAVRAAEARIVPAGRLPDPELQLGLMNRSLPGFGLDPVLGMNQIQLMQMVPIAGKLGLSGRAARADAEAAGLRSEAMWWEQRSMAAMAFYDLFVAERSSGIIRETLQLLRGIAAVAENMYVVGEGRQADVLRARVEIARMEEDLVRMATMREAAAARLNALLGRGPESEVPPALPPEYPVDIPGRDSLTGLAITSRSMIRAGQADLDAAGARETLAGREWWPDLQVGIAYGQRPMDGGTDRMMSLMLGVSLPVYGRQRAMQREARAMTAMTEADLGAMRAETAGAVGERYADYQRAVRLASLYRSIILPQAQATAHSTQAAYRVGAVDFMTLLDAWMALNRYRLELVRLEGETGLSLAALEALTAHQLFNPDRTAAAVTPP